MALDPALKRRWLSALKSGAYKQGVGALFDRKAGTMCCIGVLCDLTDIGKWEDSHIVLVQDAGGETHGLFPQSAEDPHYEDCEQLTDPGDLYALKTGRTTVRPDELPFYELEVQLGIDPQHTRQLAALNDSSDSYDQVIEYIEDNL